MATETAKPLPEFPNLFQALDNTSVVTALLATISSALFVVPLAAGFKSDDVVPWFPVWQSSEATLVFAVLATASFVSATVLLVYAAASNVDALCSAQLAALFNTANVTDANEQEVHVASFQKATTKWYSRGMSFWLIGLPLLALAAASLVFAYVAWLATALAVAGALAATDMLRHVTGGARLVAVLVFLVAIAYVAAMIVELT